MAPHEIVSEKEWLVARKELLTKEKELTKLRDQSNEEQRALPWVKVEKSYVFDASEDDGTGSFSRFASPSSSVQTALHIIT